MALLLSPAPPITMAFPNVSLNLALFFLSHLTATSSSPPPTVISLRCANFCLRPFVDDQVFITLFTGLGLPTIFY